MDKKDGEKQQRKEGTNSIPDPAYAAWKGKKK